MNERIKELATQARLLTGWPVGEVEYQKFAELIIKECYHVVVSNPHIGTSLAGANMRKHFGVEE